MEVVGYCTLKKDAQGQSPIPMSEFQGQDVRVLEFATDGGVLVINSKATGIGMFDKEHIYRKFECTVEGDIVCPPKLDFMQRIEYTMRATTRKGGYNPLLKQMVIQASLAKGQFYDHFLWAKQD